jgi:hypothetical protein
LGAEVSFPGMEAFLKQVEAARKAYVQQFASPVFLQALSSAQAVVDQIARSPGMSSLAAAVANLHRSEPLALVSIAGLRTATSVASSPLIARILELNTELAQFGEAFSRYSVPQPSPTLAAWLDASVIDEPQLDDELEPEKEEVETFWLSAGIVTAMLLCIFVAAVKTGNWVMAERIVAMISAAVGLYAGADWVMKKVIK